MKKRKYQYNYLENDPQISDFEERSKKALKIIAILNDFIACSGLKETKDSICLDIGCSSGGITKVLVSYFKETIGIDIDKEAIKIASKNNYKNLKFELGDALNLSFKDNFFDVVVCNNVYEHVPNASKMISEIYRVLKKGGICYFAATNKYMIIESDYKLPFLSWMPKSLAHFYLKITKGKSFYYEETFSYNKLKNLVNKFKIHDYTFKVIKEPEIFRATHKFKGIISHLPLFFLKPFKFFMPQFFWILVKEEKKKF